MWIILKPRASTLRSQASEGKSEGSNMKPWRVLRVTTNPTLSSSSPVPLHNQPLLFRYTPHPAVNVKTAHHTPSSPPTSRLYQSSAHLHPANSCRLLTTKGPSTTASMSTSSPTNASPLPSIPLTIPSHLSLTPTDLHSFAPYTSWLRTLTHSLSLQHASPTHPFHAAPYALRHVTVQAVDRFGGGRIGFVKLVAEVANDAGEKLPGAVFLRGGSVAMMLVLSAEDGGDGERGGGRPRRHAPRPDDDKYVLLTVQPRVAAGSLAFAELPAGMLDGGGNFAGAAAREIEEETGLVVRAEELVDMTALALAPAPGGPGGPEDALEREQEQERLRPAMYPSPGACDEFMPVFLHERSVPRAALEEWAGKLTGLREHGEKITVKVVRLAELWREGARDGKTLAAWGLYEGLRREGRI
ncbi:hypothetical protein BDY21DRAFT_305427 [Lineolata rhizophorae]|uniref:Nudix hydrolase domain-containing protein n=1 Tax=Lineolata rhizophorae TaxID=578093 RepID=A0A6A6NXE9_9PEZI|nr:hypothetical protein BDY21DRAFT_305427 [Lineolata rhizophorae]